jgi:hypothetical protein
MPRSSLAFIVAAGLVLTGTGRASAFVPGQSLVSVAAQDLGEVIEAKKKWKFKKWKKRPPGWDRGRKTGWRGGSVPPGQRYR